MPRFPCLYCRSSRQKYIDKSYSFFCVYHCKFISILKVHVTAYGACHPAIIAKDTILVAFHVAIWWSSTNNIALCDRYIFDNTRFELIYTLVCCRQIGYNFTTIPNRITKEKLNSILSSLFNTQQWINLNEHNMKRPYTKYFSNLTRPMPLTLIWPTYWLISAMQYAYGIAR